jgi:prephenate dehydrogenase
MNAPIFERLAVVGLGLLGGSVALAAAARGLAREVRGVDPALGRAAQRGASPCSRADSPDMPAAPHPPLVSLSEAAAWADGIVIAVPVEAVESVLREAAPCLRPETIVTDTVSVKRPVAEAARRWLPAPERCVGAHPMAGGDTGGFANASAGLFEGAACILALEGHECAEVVDRVDRFWQGLGTFTVRKTPAEHDAIVSALSHAPHLIAFALGRALPGPDVLRLSGRGLRDFTRIARASPELWCEILLSNRDRVAEDVARFRHSLDALEAALGAADGPALLAALREGQRAVRAL